MSWRSWSLAIAAIVVPPLTEAVLINAAHGALGPSARSTVPWLDELVFIGALTTGLAILFWAFGQRAWYIALVYLPVIVTLLGATWLMLAPTLGGFGF